MAACKLVDMSVSISYFFNSNKPLQELAAEINEVVGCSLAPSVGNPKSAFTAFPFFGMELSLSVSVNNEKEGYADDEELKFSHYNYELDITTYWGQADARPEILSNVVYEADSKHPSFGCLSC